MQRLKKILIIGLGNIGDEYAHTRHNIGFDIADAWANKYNLKWTTDTLVEKIQYKTRGVDIRIIKPQTFMNLSGKAVNYWMKKIGVLPSQILIVVDDLAFELGVIKMRMQGNHGGHNGLKSIQEDLSTSTYPRLRCGIGNNFSQGRQVGFVLGKWNAEEMPLVNQMIANGVTVIDEIIKSNFSLAMNKVNTQ